MTDARDSPGGRAASLISLAKSKITGQPYDGGDHATVTDRIGAFVSLTLAR